MHRCPIEPSFYNVQPNNRAQIYNSFNTATPDINYNYICPVYKYYHQRYDNSSIKIRKTDLINKLRMLWEQHIV